MIKHELLYADVADVSANEESVYEISDGKGVYAVTFTEQSITVIIFSSIFHLNVPSANQKAD